MYPTTAFYSNCRIIIGCGRLLGVLTVWKPGFPDFVHTECQNRDSRNPRKDVWPRRNLPANPGVGRTWKLQTQAHSKKTRNPWHLRRLRALETPKCFREPWALQELCGHQGRGLFVKILLELKNLSIFKLFWPAWGSTGEKKNLSGPS